MNTRFVAFVSDSSTDGAVYMVCVLVDRAQADATRDALRMHDRTIGRTARRFADLDPVQRDASMTFYGGMRILGGIVLRADFRPGEADPEARHRALAATARYAIEHGAECIVIDDAIGASDHRDTSVDDALDRVDHVYSSSEDDPLLAIPEAVAHVVAHLEPTVDDVPGWLRTGVLAV